MGIKIPANRSAGCLGKESLFCLLFLSASQFAKYLLNTLYHANSPTERTFLKIRRNEKGPFTQGRL